MRPIFTRREQLAIAVGVAVAGAAMLIVAALTGTLWSAEPAPHPSALIPHPSEADRARAEKDAADIFGADIEAARRPEEKKMLAAKMLETARKLGDDPAGRWVLAVQARDLAVAAGDSGTAVKAVEMLSKYVPAPEAAERFKTWAAQADLLWYSAKAPAGYAHELWAEGERVRGQEQLAKRAVAAEWYFRALDGLEGLEAKLAEKRLRGLGWSQFIPLEEVRELFGLDPKAWKIEDGALVGKAGDVNKAEDRLLMKSPLVRSRLEFGFKIKAPSYHVGMMQVGGVCYWSSLGHWENAGLAVCREATPVVFHKRGRHIDSPAEWHSVEILVDGSRLTFSHDGVATWTGVLDSIGPHSLRPGFGSHVQPFAVKDFFCR